MSTAAVQSHSGFEQRGFSVAGTRTRLRMTRRGRVVLTSLAAVPLIIGALFVTVNAGEAAAAPQAVHAHFTYVTVAGGQSLWSIAERLAPKADPRDVIAAIVSLNQLDGGTVVPGERLAIPAEYAPATR